MTKEDALEQARALCPCQHLGEECPFCIRIAAALLRAYADGIADGWSLSQETARQEGETLREQARKLEQS